MKTRRKYYFISLSMLTGLWACEPKPLDIEVKMEAPKIVITSLFNSENELAVLVTQSFTSLTAPEKDPIDMFLRYKINNATVRLENNGKTQELIGVSPFYVASDISFLPYSEYTITVSDTLSGKSATATTIMLPQVDLDVMTLQLKQQEKDSTLHLKLQMNDAGIGRKFYLATFKLNQERPAIPVKNSLTKKSLYDQIELFDNSEIKNGKLTYERTYKKETCIFRDDDSLLVDVSEVSESYYNYLCVYKKMGSFINQLTGEPINFPGNVKQGAGYFFLLNPVYREFELGQ